MGYLKKSQLSPNQLHLENTSVTQNSAEFFVRCAVGMSLNFCIEREYLSVEVTLNGENHPHTNVGRQTSEGSIAEIKITFDTEAEGNYVVSAQLYGEHIRNSPLNLELKSKLPTNEVSSQFTQGCLSPIAESEVESFVIDFQPRESRPLRY